ncbi:uncharacterized protein LOC121986075 isoform X1 [Zingiber officinale]|uniref:uncharacterized protein LOC121986075 isoform X1 n=1 Tax=Zingiber officinale TaxID=94328 RepID=UPI001C4AD66A|nr:uncharacterized protein LOC121986075 isoform X1 [Zingiber officinale]
MVWLIAEAPLEEEPAVMKRRASPQSPLDLCRSASASSAEKPEVAPRSLALADEACCIEVVAAPSIPASALIRRPAARKMTKLELQAMERTLFEERAKLRKSSLSYKMMVLPPTSMADFQIGNGVIEMVVLGNKVRGFREVGVDENYVSDDGYGRGGQASRYDNSWSQNAKSRRNNEDDGLIGERSSRAPSFGNRERGFADAGFNCDRSGHHAS